MKNTASVHPIPSLPSSMHLPTTAEDLSLGVSQNEMGLLSRAWKWIRSRQLVRSNMKRLQVAETVSLGEKRFVAVVQVDGRHFLLAGGPTNIALLAQLNETEPFEDVLKKTMTAPPMESENPAPKRLTNRKKKKSRSVIAATPGAKKDTTPAQVTNNGTFAEVVKKTMLVTEKQGVRAPGKPAAQRTTTAKVPAGAGRHEKRSFDKWLQETATATQTKPAKGSSPSLFREEGSVAARNAEHPEGRAFDKWLRGTLAAADRLTPVKQNSKPARRPAPDMQERVEVPPQLSPLRATAPAEAWQPEPAFLPEQQPLTNGHVGNASIIEEYA